MLRQVPIRGMGQAQIRAGQGFMGPFGIYSDIGPAGGYAPPPGFPAMAEEVSVPGGELTQLHCYDCPDGTVRSLTIAQARVAGCRPLDYNDPRCPALPKAPPVGRRMGQNGGPPSSPPAGGPPSVSVTPTTVNGGTDLDNQFFTFPNWTWPLYPPQYAPSYGKMVCRKTTDAEGEEVFICDRPEVPRPEALHPIVRYPTYFFPRWF